MAQWVAKLALAEKEFRDTRAQLDKPGGEKMMANLAQGGSWFLEAVDLLEQSDEDAFQHIRDQLADLNSDQSVYIFIEETTSTCPAFKA
jgi:hypothetical protein